MGKTKGKAPIKSVVTPVPVPPMVGSGTSTSSSASANSYQNLIRALFSIPEGAGEEKNEILKKLSAEYKILAGSNILNTMKGEYLAVELQEIQQKFGDASADYSITKEEHDALNSKYIKLKQLSQQLSDRTKQSDAKAAAVLYEEQQKRVKLTENFSSSIASISSKLDSLTTRREAVVTENIRLKAILKSYLEEFDADQRAQQQESSVDTGSGEDDPSLPPLDPPVTESDSSLIASGDIHNMTTGEEGQDDSTLPKVVESAESVSTVSASPAHLVESSAQEQADRASETVDQELVAAAEDVARLAELRAVERELRLKSAKYSELFESFQTKLAGCNTGFQAKQSSIEALSKEMVSLEKENAIVSKRVADCVLSTKVMMNMHSNTLAETQKQVKVMERFSALIDLMQQEIDASASAV